MMNTRVLELLKNPKNIQSEDLQLLKEEINSFPYIQNIRALHLYGVHLYDKENYQKVLSATAAYTTDKKILYQLINGKIQQQVKPEIVEKEEIISDKIIETPIQENEIVKEEIPVERETIKPPVHDYEAAADGLVTEKPEIKHVIVKGERNRILFEGEENFLEEKNSDVIDLESTLESGIIVTQKLSGNQEIANEIQKTEADQPKELTEFSSDLKVNEDKIDSEKVVEEIKSDAELSFQKIESFPAENEIKTEENTSIQNEEEFKNNEAAKSELIINEDKIDLEKIVDKIKDESELSFQKIESFPAGTEIHNEEKISTESESDSDKFGETTETLNPELIIEEEKIESEQVAKKINDDSELSFHGTDSFLPEVKIETNNSQKTAQSETPKANINKHEEEMRRLIAEVERKMKVKQQSTPENKNVEEEEAGHDHDISFSETQVFHIGEEQKSAEKVTEESENVEEKIVEQKDSANIIEENKDEAPENNAEKANSAWKPMNFESSLPDSLINKSNEISQPKPQIPESEKTPEQKTIAEPKQTDKNPERSFEAVKEVLEPETIKAPEEKEEAPVMNVSFFGSDIASLGLSYKSDQKEKAEAKEKAENTAEPETDDSNVPGFINTWQSWLKIDRTEEETPKDKAEIKNKVIESFIENNPKISQLKDEVNFVVKEKTDDISHLMTETLANLYIEQKLYTKAINAFQALANKHPERKAYFEEKIQEIKDNRGKN